MDTRNNEAEADSSTSMQSNDISGPFHMPQPRLKGYVRIKLKTKMFSKIILSTARSAHKYNKEWRRFFC